MQGCLSSSHTGFRKVRMECCLQNLACLAKVVSQNQELAGVRPSLMAASLLVADRQAHGELPSWPACLARLTGYAPAHLQDLANAHLPALRCGSDAARCCLLCGAACGHVISGSGHVCKGTCSAPDVANPSLVRRLCHAPGCVAYRVDDTSGGISP